MHRILSACFCLAVCLVVGCGTDAPTDPNDPPPKTEVIKNKDGSEEVRTSDPAGGK